MSNKSAAAAIRYALENVTPLMRHGSQWHYNTWSEYHRAWWMGHPQEYWQARCNRSATLVRCAAGYLGYAEEDCIDHDYANKGGDWRSYVRQLTKDKAKEQGNENSTITR